MPKSSAIYFGAAAAIAVAGMIHLMLGPGNLNFNVNQGILFIVGGIAQIFWIIPMIRRWGRIWYSIGIAGTAVFMALFFITRTQGNPITGRGAGFNTMSILVEIFQAIFIGLAITIIVYESRKTLVAAQTAASELPPKKGNRAVAILSGIVVALILSAVFVLPLTMPRPMGGPQGGSGRPGGPPGVAGEDGTSGQPSVQIGTVATNQTCKITPVVAEQEEEVTSTPQATEGPYFVDEGLNRSDIRSDPSSGKVEPGVPLTVVFYVFDVDKGECVPIKGAQMDVWHANSTGFYSDVQQAGTGAVKFLRGYQTTDQDGKVTFTTVYPGWYQGRAVHLHFKVRMFEGTEKTLEFTSQLFFNDTTSNSVYSQAPYKQHGQPDTTNGNDGIFNGASTDGLFPSKTGEHLMFNIAKQNEGYVGTFNIGLKLNQTGNIA